MQGKSSYLTIQNQQLLNFKPGQYSELSRSQGKQNAAYGQMTGRQQYMVPNQKEEKRLQVDFSLPQHSTSYKGTVGMIQTLLENEECVGTGTVISYGNKSILLTCAHNLVKEVDNPSGKQLKLVSSATFNYQQKEYQQSLKQSRISNVDFDVYYKNDPSIFRGSDIAIATLDNSSKFLDSSEPTESNWSFLECANPKEGEEIVVIGYPGELDKNGRCYEMKGTILEIAENDANEDRSLIKYSDIDTTQGQSGSPVFLKRGDQYTLIGIHAGTGSDDDGKTRYNLATAITRDLYNWIVRYFESI